MSLETNTLTLNGITRTLEEWISLEHGPGEWNAIRDFLSDWIRSDELTVHTSGSTGEPKPIKLSKESIIRSAQITTERFALDHSHRALLCLPVRFIAGKLMIVRALVSGLDLIPVRPSSKPLEAIDQKLDFAAMTPMQVVDSLTFNPNKFEQIQTVIIGGAPVPGSLEKKLVALPNDIYLTYGMTETITHAALRRPGREEFLALPGFSFWIDERSCLTIRASHLPEEIITNDVVELADTRSFIWKGRYDNVINSGGIKIHPEAVEAKLSGLLDRRFYITGIPDERLGTAVVLVVEGEPLDKITSGLLMSTIQDELETYECPKHILFDPVFDETDTGKVKRKKTDHSL